MKQKLFKVVFVTGQVEEVVAFNGEEAKILAQAEQIKKCNNYEVLSVTNL